MSTLTSSTTIVTDAVARLTDVFRDKAVIRALAEVIAERYAHRSSVWLDVYARQWIDNATGDLLDALGEIVGEPRFGRSDDLFRLWIRARVRINRTAGLITDSYHLARLIVGTHSVVRYIPNPPAAYRMDIEATDVPVTELYRLLDAVRPAGVRMQLIYSPDEDLTNIFTVGDSSAPVTGDALRGLGDSSTPEYGGRLRGIV